ncbi:MAG: arsenate reductase ArsC, partial [Deltaproteobacteria bacterium]|nr:arsenate reductase ArsC [Deltaproteobacteria bacterium]
MKILFICEYNACRSQMAEGIARHLLPKTVSVASAGLYPGELNQWTIDVMNEIGIDISSHRSKKLEIVADDTYDYIITLAEPASAAVRALAAKNHLSWFHPDPAAELGGAEEVKAKIRGVRDALRKR